MHSSSPFVVSSVLLFSLPFIFFLGPQILPPKTLPAIPEPDEADDLALFRRATLASVAAASGGAAAGLRRRLSSPPKIAFMFLINSDIAFAPVWELFFRGHERLFNIYVHADPLAELVLPPTKSFRGRFIPAKSTQRASPTLISAARRLLAAALVDDPANAFFALISQHCIPLHSFRYVYNALISDPGVTSPADSFHRRHRSFIQIVADDPFLHNRYIARGDNVMLPDVPFESFRVGSQFFILARRHALLVVRDRRLWKKFRMPCLKKMQSSCYPEEHYFPTLLDMQDPEGCSGFTLTRVNWTDSVDGHPHTYFPGEISGDLILDLRQSNSTYSYLFARKFSPDCLKPLLAIAETVIFKD